MFDILCLLITDNYDALLALLHTFSLFCHLYLCNISYCPPTTSSGLNTEQ